MEPTLDGQAWEGSFQTLGLTSDMWPFARDYMREFAKFHGWKLKGLKRGKGKVTFQLEPRREKDSRHSRPRPRRASPGTSSESQKDLAE